MSAQTIRYLVGTGGIGKGILFQFHENDTLGRNESRLATLTDYKDFCKAHIILHYAAVLRPEDFLVYALGAVGNDAAGSELLQTMKQAGIDTRSVAVKENAKTLYAVCFQYPSGEGGNITAKNSACDLVDEKLVDEFFQNNPLCGAGIVLAVPEVPLQARNQLLRQGRQRGWLNIASVLSAEMDEALAEGMLDRTDLLVVNEDEVAALAKSLKLPTDSAEALAAKVYSELSRRNPSLCLITTLGKRGAVFHGPQGTRSYTAIPCENVASTAGAGDCFLGTLISALVHGIPLSSVGEKRPEIDDAISLASLASGRKVSCRDSIDFSITKRTLEEFAQEKKIPITKEIRERYFQ